jgi:hypothetical protein
MVRRLVPPPVSPARGPPTDRGEFFSAWAHDDRDVFQSPHDQRPVIDVHSLGPVLETRQGSVGQADSGEPYAQGKCLSPCAAKGTGESSHPTPQPDYLFSGMSQNAPIPTNGDTNCPTCTS